MELVSAQGQGDGVFIIWLIGWLISGCAGYCSGSSGVTLRRGFRCGVQSSPCTDVSCCGTWVLGQELQWLLFLGSGAQLSICGNGLHCSKACGICLDQGLNRCLLHWQADSMSLSQQGKPGDEVFKGKSREFPGGPVAKTALTAKGQDSISGGEPRSHSRGAWPKTKLNKCKHLFIF